MTEETNTKAPVVIWAGSERGASWYYGYWDLEGQSDLTDRCKYVRKDIHDALRDRAEALENGLRAVVGLADAGLIDEACEHARAALRQDKENDE